MAQKVSLLNGAHYTGGLVWCQILHYIKCIDSGLDGKAEGKKVAETVCIGLDLAWSARNLTGGAVIVDGELREARADLTSDAAIVEWVGSWLKHGESAVVAVDAPLCVPNAEGRRPCEAQLSEVWQKYQAGPYPSNRRLFNHDIRGEGLVRQLAEGYHFVEAAPIVPKVGGRFICEVFPHPAHVSLFDLKSIFKYKKKQKRTYEACWAGLGEYQEKLRTLVEYEPPLRDPLGILNASFVGVRGKSLKALEDRLDAVTCAYVASYLWRHGPTGVWTYGTVADGHIIVPRYPLPSS